MASQVADRLSLTALPSPLECLFDCHLIGVPFVLVSNALGFRACQSFVRFGWSFVLFSNCFSVPRLANGSFLQPGGASRVAKGSLLQPRLVNLGVPFVLDSIGFVFHCC